MLRILSGDFEYIYLVCIIGIRRWMHGDGLYAGIHGHVCCAVPAWWAYLASDPSLPLAPYANSLCLRLPLYDLLLPSIDLFLPLPLRGENKYSNANSNAPE